MDEFFLHVAHMFFIVAIRGDLYTKKFMRCIFRSLADWKTALIVCAYNGGMKITFDVVFR